MPPTAPRQLDASDLDRDYLNANWWRLSPRSDKPAEDAAAAARHFDAAYNEQPTMIVTQGLHLLAGPIPAARAPQMRFGGTL